MSAMLKKIAAEELKHLIHEQGMGMVTITDVTASNDLRFAKVYFSIVGGQKKPEKQRNIIEKKAKALRKEISGKIILKYMPKLQMIFDETPQRAQRIEILLHKARETETWTTEEDDKNSG